MDEALTSAGRQLERRSCPGSYATFGKLNCFGLPLSAPCCKGNIGVLHGRCPPPGRSVDDMAELVRVARGFTGDYRAVVNMVPPPVSRIVSAQMGHLLVHHALGLPVLSYDALQNDPALLA